MKSKIASPIYLSGSGHENQKNKLQNMSKNLKTILIIAFIAILSSCSKKGDTPAIEEGNGTFSCKIDGVHFTATSATGGDNSANTTPGVLRATTINARDTNGITMIFQLIEGNAKVGIITLDGTNGSIINYGKDTNFSFPSAGSLNIISFTSTRAKGTFQFTLNNQRDNSTARKVVTEGVFDVPLQNGF